MLQSFFLKRPFLAYICVNISLTLGRLFCVGLFSQIRAAFSLGICPLTNHRLQQNEAWSDPRPYSNTTVRGLSGRDGQVLPFSGNVCLLWGLRQTEAIFKSIWVCCNSNDYSNTLLLPTSSHLTSLPKGWLINIRLPRNRVFIKYVTRCWYPYSTDI